MGDLNGDGRADIIGFGDAGVYSAISNGDGTFAAATFILADMGYDDGWRIEKHPRFAADVTGDGKADLVGFGDDGVWVSVTGESGATLVLDGFCYNQGWRVPLHPRYLADLNGDGKADIIGFGDAGVWIALSNGDGTFQAASFVLADFGYHAGPVVQSITIDFHTYNDDLNDDSLLHIFVKNRSSDSSDSAGPSTYVANLQSYQDHDADWFSKNPYLGCAINASEGHTFGNNSTHRVYIRLRSKPIPVEELLLPAVNIHILAKDSDTWKFDYTMTITLDDGTVLPPFSSNIEGLTGHRPRPGQPQLLRHLHRGSARSAPHHTGHGLRPDRRDDRIQHARRRQELRHRARHPHRQPSECDGQPGHLGRQQRRAGSDVPRFRRHLQSLRSSARLQCHLSAGHGPAGRLHQHRRRHGPVDLRLSHDVLLRPGPALFVDGVRRRARSGPSQAHGRLQRTRLSDPLLSVPSAEL